jgi:hypothetical protein
VKRIEFAHAKSVAYTKPSGSYPGYLNVAESDERVRIIVRGDVSYDSFTGHAIEGATATLTLTPEEWRLLLASLAKAAG